MRPAVRCVEDQRGPRRAHGQATNWGHAGTQPNPGADHGATEDAGRDRRHAGRRERSSPMPWRPCATALRVSGVAQRAGPGGPGGPGRRRSVLTISRLQDRFYDDAVPGRHLHIRERCGAPRHPRSVSPGRRGSRQHRLWRHAATDGPATPPSPSPSGSRDEADVRLIETAEVALQAGIAAAVVGAKLGDISAAIGSVGRGRRLRHQHRLRRPRDRPRHARGALGAQRRASGAEG